MTQKKPVDPGRKDQKSFIPKYVWPAIPLTALIAGITMWIATPSEAPEWQFWTVGLILALAVYSVIAGFILSREWSLKAWKYQVIPISMVVFGVALGICDLIFIAFSLFGWT